MAYVVQGSDGKVYGVGDACQKAFVFTEWNEFAWGNDAGATSSTNSSEFYKTVGKNLKSWTETNAPALNDAKYFGVDAKGVWHEAE